MYINLNNIATVRTCPLKFQVLIQDLPNPVATLKPDYDLPPENYFLEIEKGKQKDSLTLLWHFCAASFRLSTFSMS